MSIITKLQSKFEHVDTNDNYIFIGRGHIRVSLHINRIGRVTDFTEVNPIDYSKCAFYNRNPTLRDAIQNLLTEIMDTIEFRQVEYVGNIADFTGREFLFIARSSRTLMFTLEVKIEENLRTPEDLRIGTSKGHSRVLNRVFGDIENTSTFEDDLPSNGFLNLKETYGGVIMESMYNDDSITTFKGLRDETIFESTVNSKEVSYSPKTGHDLNGLLRPYFRNLDYFTDKEIIGVYVLGNTLRLTVRDTESIKLVYIVSKVDYIKDGFKRLLNAYVHANGVPSTGEDLLILTTKFTHYYK